MTNVKSIEDQSMCALHDAYLRWFVAWIISGNISTDVVYLLNIHSSMRFHQNIMRVLILFITRAKLKWIHMNIFVGFTAKGKH